MSAGHGDAFAQGGDYSVATLAYVAALLVLSGVVPFLVGLAVGRLAAWWRQLAAAFSIGIVALLLLDYVKEAADLGQATGDARTIAVLVGSLVIGALVAGAFASRAGAASGAALAWAVAVGLHGLGEGLLISSEVATGTFHLSVTQGASFGIHKGLEGFVLAALFVAAPRARTLVVVAAVALVPMMVAPIVAIVSPVLLPSVAFAAGAGAALLALPALGAVVAPAGRVTLRVAACVLAGALAVFFAGLLHQF